MRTWTRLRVGMWIAAADGSDPSFLSRRDARVALQICPYLAPLFLRHRCLLTPGRKQLNLKLIVLRRLTKKRFSLP